jgi:hypothetical protein
MGRQYRKLDQLMMSLGDKEATYDAGPAAWTLGAAFQLYEFGEAFAVWDDRIVTDEATVHGSIYPTADSIVLQDVRLAYPEPRARYTPLAGLAALAGGVVSASQDAALTAYRHKITPVAADVELPSIGVVEKAAGLQYLYTGIKADTLRLKRGGPERAYWELEAGLIGSGTRAADSTAFPAKVSEDPIPWGKTFCWLETGTDINLAATPTQGTEDISSATPDNFTARLLDVTFEHRNDLQADDGYTASSGVVRNRLVHGPGRGATVSITLIVDPATLAAELAYYTGRANCALEVEVDSGTIIAETGTMKWGFDLVIPRLRLNPPARGVDRGVNTITLSGRCFDDGTNPLWQLYVYNAQAAFLA